MEDLAAASITLVDKVERGVIHVAGPAMVDSHAVAGAVCRAFDVDARGGAAITTAALKQKAPRPLLAGLRSERAPALGLVTRAPDAGLAAMRAALEGQRG